MEFSVCFKIRLQDIANWKEQRLETTNPLGLKFIGVGAVVWSDEPREEKSYTLDTNVFVFQAEVYTNEECFGKHI